MNKKMKALSKFRCFVMIKDGKVLICEMETEGLRKGLPVKNGYKPAWKEWQPNEKTKPEFIEAVNKILGTNIKNG